MPFEDKRIVCRDCGKPFTFTANEQAFYESRGLTSEPRRCRDCREARRAGPEPPSESGVADYGTFASFGGRTPRQLHPAVCDGCGEATEVPFQPRQNRPVYCSSCYERIQKKGGE